MGLTELTGEVLDEKYRIEKNLAKAGWARSILPLILEPIVQSRSK